MSVGSDDWEGFCIGREPTPALRVVYLKAAGIPEEGWHQFSAEAATECFTGRLIFESLLYPFEDFMHQVKSMYDTLKGEAHFESMEGEVSVDATIDKFGHVFWTISLCPNLSRSSELMFTIEQDQTLLLNVASKIDEMLVALGGSQ